jgi:DNA-binding PucR family transcriptional regulator
MPPQKQELMQALRQANGNITEAAKLMGIHRGTVRNRMLKWGIDLRRTVFS